MARFADTRTAYVYYYSLDAQYALPFRLTSYTRIPGQFESQVDSTRESTICSTGDSGELFAFAVFIPTPDVNANYNAMNARLTRRFASRLPV